MQLSFYLGGLFDTDRTTGSSPLLAALDVHVYRQAVPLTNLILVSTQS